MICPFELNSIWHWLYPNLCRPMYASYGFLQLQFLFIVYSSTFFFTLLKLVLQACGSFISCWCRQHAKHWHLEFRMIIYFSRIADNIKHLRESIQHTFDKVGSYIYNCISRHRRLLLLTDRTNACFSEHRKTTDAELQSNQLIAQCTFCKDPNFKLSCSAVIPVECFQF